MRRIINSLLLLSFALTVICNVSLAQISVWDVYDNAFRPNNSLTLGNMLKPFTPPTLEELNAKAETQGGWVVNPVKDGGKMAYQYLNGKPAPTTVKEALSLKNDSPENNDKILHTLGRLPENEEKEVDFDQTLVRSVSSVQSVNPIMMNSVAEFDLANLMSIGIISHTYDTMESYASSDSVREWKTMPDRLCDIIILRDDITWSDGEPFTAYDVEFSFKLIMTKEVPTPAMRSGTDQIKACVAYNDHTLVFFHKEPLVTNALNMNFAIIPKHIYEKTWAADPTLTSSDEHVKLEYNPVVAGPYKISKIVPNQYIELEAREDYYMHQGKKVRDRPYVKKIRFVKFPTAKLALMAMKRGDLDFLQVDFEQWNTKTSSSAFYNKCTKVQASEWTSFHICWNMKTPYFEDVRVRKAMSYAFDYETMFNDILLNQAEPSYGIFHKNHPAFPKDAKPPYHQDLDKAKELLKEAGWEDHNGDGTLDKLVTVGAMIRENKIYIVKVEDKEIPLKAVEQGKEIVGTDGTRYIIKNNKTYIISEDDKKEFSDDFIITVPDVDHIVLTNGKKIDLTQYYLPFEFTLYCNNSSYTSFQICELMKRSLKSVGVSCVVRPIEFAALMQLEQTHDFDAALGGWGAGTDPDTSENIWGTGKNRNYGFYSNAEVDELFYKGKRETDRAKRMDIYGRIHNIIYEEQPYTFLYCRNSFYVVSKRIRGYGFYPRGIIEGNIWIPKEKADED